MTYALWCAAALCCLSAEYLRILQHSGYKPQRGYFRCFFTWHFAVTAAVAAYGLFCRFCAPLPWLVCGGYTLAALPLTLIRKKSPLRFTKRAVRIFAVNFALTAVLSWQFACFLPVFTPLTVLLAWLLCLPADCVIARIYIRKACRKLRDSGVTVVAITGSYGKTSCKDMLHALLCDSIAPDGSCNTPLGIAAFINRSELSGRYLVLEFGARKRGDIALLCRLYKPFCGIITGVCAQHLSTFKREENVLAAKRELAENVPSNGFCVMGEGAKALLGAGASATTLTSVQCRDVTLSPQGITFVAKRDGETAQISLPHVTEYSADTFALCAEVCLRLGQSFAATVKNAAFVRQTAHRMQVTYNGRFYVIDDSYNASIEGVKGACRTLEKLRGVVALSQGIVEGGKRTVELNRRCGEMLGNCCETVVAIGKNASYIAEGASKTGCRVLTAKNLKEGLKAALPYVKREGFLLFQNDLPDLPNV